MSTPEQWELGAEVLEQGTEHPALRAVQREWEKVLKALAEANQTSRNLKKVGVGRTEDPTLVVSRVVPALREHARVVALVANQLEERLR